MHLLFDSLSVQVLEQQATHTRLNTLLGALKSAGTSLKDPWVVSYSVDRITQQQLAGIDVLVVLTRDSAPQSAYTSHEIDTIFDYVHGGGNLLLMTSHAPNMVNDAPLTARFGITVHPTFVSNPLVHDIAVNPMVMSAHCLNASLADGLLYQVTSLVAHDSPEISGPPSAVSIATFPSTAVVAPGGHAPTHKDFALALRSGSGHVIVVGNSGMVCDYGNAAPSCGFIPMGSNLFFFLDCIRVVGGLQKPTYNGFCPGVRS